MKKIVLLFPFFLLGCSTPKSLVTDPAIVRAHPKPIRIFEIGYWGSKYMILTLLDAKNEYFIIRVYRDDRLVSGALYQK